MIYCFIIDISSSTTASSSIEPPLNGPCFGYLDLAKAFVESFYLSASKTIHSSSPSSSLPSSPPHFMLLTAEESFSSSLKCSLGESTLLFENAIKSLEINKQISSPAFSFSLTFAADIINKYRIKNRIDSLGEGFRPWCIDPVTFFLLSREEISSFSPPTTQTSDFSISDWFRWDAKLYSIVLAPSSTNSNSLSSSSLSSSSSSFSNSSSLSTTTASLLASQLGGETLIYRTLKEITSRANALVTQCSQVSLQLQLATPSSKLNVLLFPNGNNLLGYPIPEKYPIDSNTEHLTVRSAFPHLTLLTSEDFLREANEMLLLITQLKIPMESYVIDLLDGTSVLRMNKSEEGTAINTSVHQSLGI